LGRDGQHAANHQRTGDATAFDALFFEPHADQRGGNVLSGVTVDQVHGLREPIERNLGHYNSIPNCCEKRTSPSTMSRMSFTPWRNIRVRSIPMPNANAVYSSGSIPAAMSTFGCVIPQPPHSIQPVPEHVRQAVSS